MTGDPPLGLILESPFNNIVDAAAQHPFAFVSHCFFYGNSYKALSGVCNSGTIYCSAMMPDVLNICMSFQS